MTLKPTKTLFTILIAFICLSSCDFMITDTGASNKKPPKPIYKTSKSVLEKNIENIIQAEDHTIGWRFDSEPVSAYKYSVTVKNPSKDLITENKIEAYSNKIKFATEEEVKNLMDFDGLVIEFRKTDSINDCERTVTYKKTYKF